MVLNALLSVEAGTAAVRNAAASLQTAKIFSHWMEGKKSKLLGYEQAPRGVSVCPAVPVVQWFLVVCVGDAFLGANHTGAPQVQMCVPMPLVDLCCLTVELRWLARDGPKAGKSMQGED